MKNLLILPSDKLTRSEKEVKIELLQKKINGLEARITEEEANAKLIAAAPELLNACIHALTILKTVHRPNSDWINGTVREAIKKATS